MKTSIVTCVRKSYTYYEIVFEGNGSPKVVPVASEHRNPGLLVMLQVYENRTPVTKRFVKAKVAPRQPPSQPASPHHVDSIPVSGFIGIYVHIIYIYVHIVYSLVASGLFACGQVVWNPLDSYRILRIL